jgi:hypothetical protein
MTPRLRPPTRRGILHLPHRTHAGARQRHRARGNAALRSTTSVAVAGGLILASGFSLLAFNATSDHDAARARLVATRQRQYEIRMAAVARQRGQAADAQARASRLARYSAIRAAGARQAAATQAAAAQAAAAQAAAQTAASSAAFSASSSNASNASSATQVPASGSSQSTPVASAGAS